MATAADGGEDREIAEFDTFTDALIRWRDWLNERDCPVAAMESTRVYRCPVHNVLEGFVKVVLVKAWHIKVNKSQGLLSGQTIRLTGAKSQACLIPLRRIAYRDAATGRG